MKIKLLVALAVSIVSVGVFAQIAPIAPKPFTQFYCSPDLKSMIQTNGTITFVVRDDLIVYNPFGGGCTPAMVMQITQKGYFCFGHWLTKYDGTQQQEGTEAQCQSDFNNLPPMSWN